MMTLRRPHPASTDPTISARPRRTAAQRGRRLGLLLVSLLLLSGCLDFFQEIRLEEDGSGRTVIRYAAQTSLVEGNPLLQGLLLEQGQIHRHFAERPGLHLDGADVWDRDGNRYVRLQVAFDDVALLSDDAIQYSWGVEGGHKVFRITLKRRQHRTPRSPMQDQAARAMVQYGFTFKVRLPGRVVDTNSEKAQWSTVEWFVPLGFFLDPEAKEMVLYAKLEASRWEIFKGWVGGLFGS